MPLLLLLAALPPPALASRIKDLAGVRGVRPELLLGNGLVVGLNGTGDTYKAKAAVQQVIALMKRRGMLLDPKGLKVKNVAAVVVTAELAPFYRKGQAIDVTVSSMGDAKDLSGGTLLMTPLSDLQKRTVAVAQGPLSVGGFSAGGGGTSIVRNHPTVARIPNGALVEVDAPQGFSDRAALFLQLHRADFTTAARMAKVINMELGGIFAWARDAGLVKVQVPEPYKGRAVELLALVERLEVVPDAAAVIIFNERTGTVVIGQDVRIAPVAVAHGNLTVTVEVQRRLVPAAPFSPGETREQRNTRVAIDDAPDRRLVQLDGAATLADVVEGLNALGASPRDIGTILQAIDAAGALRGVLRVE